MFAYASLNHALDAIGKSSNDKDVWDTLFTFMKMCRVQALVYHHQSPLVSSDFGGGLIVKEFFDNNNTIQADIVDQILSTKLQHKITEIPRQIMWSYMVKDLEDIFKEGAKLEGFKIDQEISGVSFPVHGPRGRSGCFSLVFGEDGGGSSEEEIRVLKWVCQNTHQAICKIKFDEFENKISLTKRETEILSWVARGKSNTVIADILGISHHTVNTYLRRIFLKTGKADRTSVALLGIYQGLVNL